MSRNPVRRLTGVQIRKNCIMAYVKVIVNGKAMQKSKSFSTTADPDEIQTWQLDTRKKLRAQGPAKGTLAADIAKHLSSLEGRRKRDAHTWLNKWASSPLGEKPRSEITPEQVADQLLRFKTRGGKRYGAESQNHLRQELINLWRALDGKKHTCPASELEKFDPPPARRGFF